MAGFAAANVRAQVGGIVGQVDNTQTRQQLNLAAQSQLAASNTVPPLYEGETSDLGPQSVLLPRPHHTLFQATADEQLFYSDNVFQTTHDKISSGVILSTAEFDLAPTPYAFAGGLLAPRVGYQAQWFDYVFNGNHKVPLAPFGFPRVNLSTFDFNAQTPFADVTWSRGGWSFAGGMEAERLFYTSHEDPFYSECAPYWLARYIFPVCDATVLSASYEGDYRFTSIPVSRSLNIVGPTEFSTANANNRTDQGLLLSLTQVLHKHVVFEPYYQFKYTHFTDYPTSVTPDGLRVPPPRNDYLNTFGAGLYWLPCQHFSVRGFVNYNILASDNSAVAQYKEFDGGVGVNLTIRF